MYQKLQTGRATAMAELLSDTIDNVNLNNVAVSSTATPGSGGTVLVDTSLDTGAELITNGDFSATGSELVTNGDFSATGADLITNGDFSATGSELIVDGDFPTPNVNWTLINATLDSGGARVDNGATTDNAYVLQTLTNSPSGKSFVLTYDVIATDGGTLAIEQLSSSDLDTSTIGTNRKFYFTWDRANDELVIKRKSGTSVDITIDNVSVKELGEDWSLNGVGGISFNGGGLSFDSSEIDTSGGGGSTVFSTCSQIGTILEIGKSYKLVIEDLDITSGSIELKWGRDFGTVPQRPILTSADNGTYTDYFTAVSINDSFTINSGGNTVATLSSISVQELGEDWTIVGTEDANHYVNFVDGGARLYFLTVTPIIELKQIAIAANTNYKFTCNTAYTGSGRLKVALSGTNYVLSNEGLNTIYFQSGSGTEISFLRNSPSVDCLLSNVTLQELGEDWVSVDDTNTFGENGLTMTSTEAADVKIYQPNVITSSKSYKVTYTIHENGLTGSNTLQYYTGDATLSYEALPEQGVGTHTFYYTAPSGANDRWYFKLNLAGGSTSTTDFVTISYISVEESENAGFVPIGVKVGDIVYNTASIPNVATVVGISPDGDTLTLSNDISVTSGVPYKILSRTNSAATLYIGTVGVSATLKVRTAGGDDVTLDNLVQGTTLPTQVVRVYNTGTVNVSNILALF